MSCQNLQCLELIVSCLVTRLNGVNGKDVKFIFQFFLNFPPPSSKQDCPLLLDQQQTLQLPFKLSTWAAAQPETNSWTNG